MANLPDIKQLEQCPLFQNMTPTEFQEVLELVEYESFEPKETILQEGRSIQILWIILDGQCEVVKSRKDGGEQCLATLEPMAIFGEMSFFNPAPHSASVKTCSQVEVMRLSREKFNQLQEAGSTAAYRIAFNTVRVLTDRVRKMDEWMCELIEKPDAVGHLEEWREFRSKLYSDWQF